MPVQAAGPAVFINCPFDSAYRPLFDAMVFTIERCGFAPRCAMEVDDSAGTRIDKIMGLIGQCPLGIHDISRTDLDPGLKLPRFNMPFELGLFLGASRFGNREQKKKRCLVLDKERYRYQKFLSDIAGQDIHSHDDRPESVISEVRDFLRANSGGRSLPSGKIIRTDFGRFEKEKSTICAKLDLDPDRLIFLDLVNLIAYYLQGA